MQLALPLMVSLLFQNLYAFVDTVFVSWLGDVPLAAVSMVVPLMYVSLSMAKGISMGGIMLMSHARGSGEEGQAVRVAQGMLPLMTLSMCVFLPLLVSAVNTAFFSVIGADEALWPMIHAFIIWLIPGFFVMGYVMTAEAFFMARGDTLTPMKAMALGNIVNMGLDPILIFFCNLGVAGASLATLLGQIVAGVYLYRALRHHDYELPQLRWCVGMLDEWRRILGQGIYIAMSYAIIPVGLFFLNAVLAQFGPAALAAWNMMSRLEMLVMLPVMGLGNAMATMISFNLGRKEYARVQQCVHSFFQISLAVAVPVLLVFLLAPAQVLALFQPTPELLRLGSYALRASGIAGIFMTAVFGLLGLAQGLKRPVYMMAVSATHALGVRVPAAYFLAALGGETGVFWSHTVAAITAAGLATFFIFKLLESVKKLAKEE
nr:MATE family efflux transporter [uncultured Anaeromusa sp.]